VCSGAAWCFCTAAGSLLTSCCGNDKPSTVDPGAASGRKRSVLLLLLAIGIAFFLQYYVAPTIVNFDAPIDNILSDAWRSGCEDLTTSGLIERCAGNAGVYRSSFSAVIFFLLAGVAVACKRTANREAWPAKYVLFVFLVAGMCFIPNDPLFLTIHLNVARVGAAIFIIFQQIIFVDIAMNWNDSWVEKSNKAEEQESGSGKKWLYAILASAAALFVLSIIGWALLFVHFGNCPTNMTFIVVTVIMSILITLAQLSGEEGSLLASATITAYATMLCYSAGK
jgi:Serine incorporator (Serinc)